MKTFILLFNRADWLVEAGTKKRMSASLRAHSRVFPERGDFPDFFERDERKVAIPITVQSDRLGRFAQASSEAVPL